MSGSPHEATKGEKREIPVPFLVRLYRRLRTWPLETRLRFALALEAKPQMLARWIAASVERFEPYCNIEESFAIRPPLDPVGEVTSGRDLACALANPATGDGAWRVRTGRTSVSMQLVDHEVPPARTTKNAKHFLNKMGAVGDSTYLRTDLLLKHADGTPVIGEVKVARAPSATTKKGGGFDADAVLALVQALAAASMLATPNQLRRLQAHYPAFADGAHAIDVGLFMYKPQVAATATYQWRLDAVAWLLAHRCFGRYSAPSAIRKVHFIEVRGDPPELDLSTVATVDNPAAAGAPG